jgi:hypothetical protein
MLETSNLDDVREGEELVFRHTEAVAISLEKFK